MNITFKDFKKKPGYFEFTCTSNTGEGIETKEKVWFEFGDAIVPSDDAIALALSTLTGNKYSDIYM